MSRSLESILIKKAALQFKKLRIEHELTQEDVYNDTGIHIARLELGKRDFSVSTLKKLCDYFNVKLEDFFKDLKC
jgi:transcriptional regulator with XRE-family HTH domain